MKSLLFVYHAMNVGGSTTSLLSLLFGLDKSKYDIDLRLFNNKGEYLDSIPENIKLLPPCYKYQDEAERKKRMLLSPKFMAYKIASIIKGRLWHSIKQGQQWLEYKDVDFFLETEKEYDLAIAFLEGGPCKYVAKHTKAKRKIAWIHIDYKESSFRPEFDIDSLSCFDTIVTVSQECKKSFCESFPTLADRCIVIENILSASRLWSLSAADCELNVDNTKLNLVSACRIAFNSKGLDRAVTALARIKTEYPDLADSWHWYIIGDGNDQPLLLQMIKDNHLENNISLLGKQINPFPYLKQMSLFFLPSRWEGKPMAVTEGFIMGLPALVTEYASAHEQVKNDFDGLVVPNSTEGIYEGLLYVLNNPARLKQWQENVKISEYSNEDEIKRIEAIFDELL